MGILFIVLTILKYVILTLLVLMAVILLTPIFYAVKADKERDGVFTGQFRVRLFLGLISLFLSYDGEFSVSMFILGIRFPRSGKENKDNPVSTEPPTMDTTTAPGSTDEPNPRLDQKSGEAKEPHRASNKKTARTKTAEASQSVPDKIKNIYDKINFIYHYPQLKDLANLGIRLIKRLLRAMLPRRASADGEVGFENPSTTGLFMAAESLIISCVRVPRRYSVCIRGNLAEEVVIIHLNAKGRFSVISLLWPIVAFVFSKPVFKIILKYLKRKDDTNEQ